MSSESERRWRVLASDYVVETPYLRLRRDRIELPNGVRVDDYFVRESRGFSVIFATTTDDRVVLVRQYKHGAATRVLELPAGAIDEGETALGCAERELAEETGFVVAPPGLEHVATLFTDPTNSDGRLFLFAGRDARRERAPTPDPTEEIAVELARFSELRRYAADGTIEVAAHVAAIYLMLDRLGRL